MLYALIQKFYFCKPLIQMIQKCSKNEKKIFTPALLITVKTKLKLKHHPLTYKTQRIKLNVNITRVTV